MTVEGPESTPYKGGVFLLSAYFPSEYPNVAPIVTFLTKIRHCNVSPYGKVCHSLLDRNWNPDVPMRTVLEALYGLLLSPEVSDPLDSTVALQFYEASGSYEAQILDFTRKFASKSRQQWFDELDKSESIVIAERKKRKGSDKKAESPSEKEDHTTKKEKKAVTSPGKPEVESEKGSTKKSDPKRKIKTESASPSETSVKAKKKKKKVVKK